VILTPPGDGRFGPVHVLRPNLHDRVHLNPKPRFILWVFHLGSEHVILFHIGFLRVVPSGLSWLPVLVPLCISWQTWRQARQLVAALLQVSGETALASGMCRRLA
jgi:hypothetical protein